MTSHHQASVAIAVLQLIVFLITGCSGEKAPTPISVTKSSTKSSIEDVRLNDCWPNLYGPEFNSRVPVPFDGQIHFAPALRWSHDIGRGYGTPIVAKERVWVVSRIEEQEKIECLNENTGELLWDYTYPTSFKNTFEYSDGPYATPLFIDGRVVTVGAQGQFHCFDLNGKLLWNRNLLEDFNVELKDWPVATSPIAVGDKIIFNLGAKKAGIVALDPETGEVVWAATDHSFSYASSIVASMHGKEFVYSMTDEGLVCLEPNKGKVLWEIAHRIRQRDRYNAVTPIAVGSRICVVTGPSVKPGFRCFEIKQDGGYDEPWKNIRLLNTQYTNFTSFGENQVFGFTPEKQGGPELVCIDLQLGKHIWKIRPELGRGNLLGLGKYLVILGESGTLAIYELEVGQPPSEVFRTSEPILSKPCYSTMAYSRGRIFARNEKKLVCYDLGLTQGGER